MHSDLFATSRGKRRTRQGTWGGVGKPSDPTTHLRCRIKDRKVHSRADGRGQIRRHPRLSTALVVLSLCHRPGISGALSPPDRSAPCQQTGTGSIEAAASTLTPAVTDQVGQI